MEHLTIGTTLTPAPNEMLQQELGGLPNVDVTLPEKLSAPLKLPALRTTLQSYQNPLGGAP
ncbi:MAG: hypothetical protein ABSF00_02490 [Candidatus Bathyarchaeia archaeon]